MSGNQTILTDNDIRHRIGHTNWQTVPKPTYKELVESAQDGTKILKASFKSDETKQIMEFLDKRHVESSAKLKAAEIDGSASLIKAAKDAHTSGNHSSYINGDEGTILLSERDRDIVTGMSRSQGLR